MAIVASVRRRTTPAIVASTSARGSFQTSTPVTLQNYTTVVTRIDQCADVDATNEENNAVLVYNSSSDKYIVQQMNLDGGSF